MEKQYDRSTTIAMIRIYIGSDLINLERDKKKFNKEEEEKIWQEYKSHKYPTEFDRYARGILAEHVCGIVKSNLEKLEKKEKKFTVDIIDRAKQDYKDMHLPAEYDSYVTKMLNMRVYSEALKIFADESKKINELNKFDDAAHKIFNKIGSRPRFLNLNLKSYANAAKTSKNMTFSNEIKMDLIDTLTSYQKDHITESDKKMREKIEWGFKEARSLEEVRIVNRYLERFPTKDGKPKDVSDALIESHYYRNLDLTKVIDTQYVKFFNIRKYGDHFKEAEHLTNVFCDGDIKELNERLSKMDKEELADFFDKPIVRLVYSQGHTLNEFAEVYLGGKKSKDEFLNSLSDALRQNPGLSQINVCSTLSPKDFNVITDIVQKHYHITFSKDTTIELSDGKGTNIPIQLKKPYVIESEMVDDIRFEEVSSEDRSLWRGAAQLKGTAPYLEFDKGFAKDISKTINNLDKLEKAQMGMRASKSNYNR